MDNFWKQCLKKFQSEFDAATFDAFIKPIESRFNDNDNLLLTTPNKATERWVKRNIEKNLREMAKTAFPDNPPPVVSYQIQPSAPTPAPSDTPSPILSSTETVKKTGLKKDFTFANFVPGAPNKLPLCAANEVAPGNEALNPLFIYGGTGLGKTHLAHAVGNEHLRLHPRHKVLCLPARAFMEEFVRACRLNQHDRFEARFCDLDMLIIDDIQFICGKKHHTQEEFFSLFNKMQEQGKNIVITGDSSPANLEKLPSRLTSRLNSGLSVQMKPPDFELRVNIVKQKSRQWNMPLNKDIAEFIAEHVKSNVRELEGAIKRVQAMARFQNIAPSLASCQKALSDIIGRTDKTISPSAVKNAVAAFYGIKSSELSAKGRQRSIVYPRHIAVYLCRQITSLSLPEIGKHFGKRNHSTILHSCRLIEQTLPQNNSLSKEIKQLEIIIRDS